jgi:hypothetical protein
LPLQTINPALLKQENYEKDRFHRIHLLIATGGFTGKRGCQAGTGIQFNQNRQCPHNRSD